MKKKEIEDRFKEEEEQAHDLYTVTLETLENNNLADFSTKNQKNTTLPSSVGSQKFIPKKHPIQTKNTLTTNGYYENQYTFIPGYLIGTEGSKETGSALGNKQSQSTSNLLKGSRPTSALHTSGIDQTHKMFNPHNFDDVQRILHPNFQQNFKRPQNCWVPGYRTHFEEIKTQIDRNPIVKAKSFKRDNTFRKTKFQYDEQEV